VNQILRKSLFAALGLFLAGGVLYAQTESGLDVLESQNFSPLRGKKVGLLCNHTALDRRGRPAAELFNRAPGVELKALFSPEHGFSGRLQHGQPIPDDYYAGVPVYSLYGKTKRPTAEMLRDLDALVFDIQDVGARFYTYIATLGYALEEAARHGLEFYVLDRPNPLGGDVAEGEPLAEDIRHFTAYYSIPTRHGLTVGEIAQWHNAHARLGAKLTVVRMKGWKRKNLWKDTGRRFVPPSPNIRSPKAALLYCGIGAFEATNVSVARGTKTPFELFGAPWMDGPRLADRLNALALPGIKFKAARFTPRSDLYAGLSCGGVRLLVMDESAVRPVDVFIHAVCLLRELHAAEFQPRWPEMPYVVGSRDFETLYKTGEPADQILQRLHAGAAEFLKTRLPYLLYE